MLRPWYVTEMREVWWECVHHKLHSAFSVTVQLDCLPRGHYIPITWMIHYSNLAIFLFKNQLWGKNQLSLTYLFHSMQVSPQSKGCMVLVLSGQKIKELTGCMLCAWAMKFVWGHWKSSLWMATKRSWKTFKVFKSIYHRYRTLQKFCKPNIY